MSFIKVGTLLTGLMGVSLCGIELEGDILIVAQQE